MCESRPRLKPRVSDPVVPPGHARGDCKDQHLDKTVSVLSQDMHLFRDKSTLLRISMNARRLMLNPDVGKTTI